MSGVLKLALRSVFVIFVAAFCSFSLAATAPSHIPISKARQQAQGEMVTVEGLVTVPPGYFRSATGDEGFAIQDQTGGIWISALKNLRLRLGQRVRVNGALETKEGKLQIVADHSNVKPLSGKELQVATGQVDAAILGFLITVEGIITQKGIKEDLPYGYKFHIDDGTGPVQIFLNASTDINPRAAYFKPGRRIRVTGFGSQYNVTYEVEPRFRGDIRPLP